MPFHSRSWLRSAALFVCLFCLVPSLSLAFKAKEEATPLDKLAFQSPQLWVTAQNADLGSLQSIVPSALAAEWQRFLAAEGKAMTLTFDRVTGKPTVIEGEGIPWIPGTANSLSAEALGLDPAMAGKEIPAEVVASKAIAFLKAYPALFGIDPATLILNRSGSGPMLDYLYFVDFRWTYAGIPVEKAYLTFRLNHGNLIQVGQEFMADAIAGLDPNPSLKPDTAWTILWNYVGGADPTDVIVEPGRLSVIPISTVAVQAGQTVPPGTGLDYRLVYTLSFRRQGTVGTWEARVDAHTGELFSFEDANWYGKIQGGVYLQDRNTSEVSKPFPYANYGSGLYADAAGNFSGTSGTSTLNGKYVKILDSCGTISQATDGTGLIDFGTSSGVDCTTPGHGGAGNSHSSRTQYWNVTEIKLKALGYMPTNNWLLGQLTDNVNINNRCNAYWDPTAKDVNFFRSGCMAPPYSSYCCDNTGELPGVSLHEWGHGMDSNDGKAAADKGTGETYGDITAMLQTHQSCMGNGFWQSNPSGTKCGGGYGDPCKACTGVRDIDYAQRQSNTPHTPYNYTRVYCPNSSYAGPCAREGHCESYVSSEACWDLAVRQLPGMGIDTTTAWQIMDRLWYASRPTAQAAFTCSSSSFTSDGSNTGSLYNVFRAVDDCDGNLANGTPHAAAIFTAMSNHAIAVGAAGDATNQNQTNCCPTLNTPNLSGTAASCQNNLSWGSINNAVTYKIYRNEIGCTSSFALIGAVSAPATTFADTPVSQGTVYYYRIQAVGSSDACTSAMSNCVTLTAAACGGSCTAPGAPTLNSATGTCSGVDLAWTAGSGTTLSYNIYRKASPCGGTYAKIAGPVTGAAYTDTTAAAGTAYAYVIKGACDSGGVTESAFSNCLTATALAVPAIPAAPTVTDDCAGLILSWTAIPGATTYTVQRRNNGCGSNGWAAAQAGVTGTTWTDTTAAGGSTYGYYIQAVNACGTAGDKNNCGSGTHSAPAAPTGLTATGACAAVNLSWTASTGATSYNVLRTTNGNCSTGLSQIGTSSTTTYSDTTAVAGTTYYYVVQAVSACGTSGNSTCANAARLQTPAAPTGLTATGTCAAVNLSWTASTGAASYEVWRTTNANCTTGAASIGTATGTTYSDTSAVGGTTYYYTVKAVNACGTSGVSNCANAARSALPAAPTGLTATGTCTAVDLSWTASAGAVSYEVWRTTSSNCTTGAGSIGTTTGTTYSDTTAVVGNTYYYTVKAVNTCGTGGASNCVNAVRLAVPAAPAGPTYTNISCTTLTVNWTVVSGATQYDVYRRTGACGAGSIIASNQTGTTYNDSGLSASTQYSYYIVAKNGCGSSANGTCTSTNTTGAPGAPAGLTATGTCTAVDLSWTAAAGATSYEIWRTTNSNCTSAASTIGTTAGTTYSDATAAAGTTYYYTVKAVNACGTSGISNCANAARLIAPGAPAITGITDNSACAQDGIRVAYTAGNEASSHDLYRDGALAVTGYASNALYNPGNTASHTYFIRAVNACGTADSGTQSFSDANNGAVPTITGAGANTCPSVSVNLTTEAGMSSYQWYRDGNPVGTNSNTHAAAQSGTYTVRYTNGSGCTGTSAGHAVTISPCVPNIVYKAGSAVISPVTEDGDGVMEAGEKWQIAVTVENLGQAPAMAVAGSLQGEGLTYCNNPGAFGNIAVGGTGTFTFTFVVDPAAWYGSYACGASIGFDLVSKSSDGGTYTYANDANFTTRQVGAAGGTTTENAAAPNISNVKNGTKTSAFAPAFTFTATVDSATTAFTLAGHPNPTFCVQLELVAPDDAAVTLKGYGGATQPSYDVTAFYNAHGAGAYILRVSEQAGCGGGGDLADCTGITMAVQKTNPGNCDTGTASCANIAPEVSDDGPHRLMAVKNSNPALVDIKFEDVGAAGYSLYVSNQPNTHPFQVTDNQFGVRTCALGTAPEMGGMRLASGVDLESGFHPTADTTILYLLVTADNGAGTEGSLGMDSAPLARTADSYCSK